MLGEAKREEKGKWREKERGGEGREEDGKKMILYNKRLISKLTGEGRRGKGRESTLGLPP